MNKSDEKNYSDLKKILRNELLSNEITIVNTVSGAGLPLTLKNMIEELNLNTYFEVESPDWFDFSSLNKLYANSNNRNVDLVVYMLDYTDGWDNYSMLDVVNNSSAKKLIVTNGVSITNIDENIEGKISFNYIDFPKVI